MLIVCFLIHTQDNYNYNLQIGTQNYCIILLLPLLSFHLHHFVSYLQLNNNDYLSTIFSIQFSQYSLKIQSQNFSQSIDYQVNKKQIYMKQSLCKDLKNKNIVLKNEGLEEIPNTLLSVLHCVTQLDLTNNQLTNQHFQVICHFANSLKSLKMQGNRITIIPKSLSSLKFLQYFNTDWHYILQSYQHFTKNSNSRLNDCKISKILFVCNHPLKLVTVDGIKGINFKTFAQEVYEINLNLFTCSIILKQIQILKINSYTKAEIKSFLSKKTSTNLILSNHQKYSKQQLQIEKFPINLKKKISIQESQHKRKLNLEIKTGRLSIDKIDRNRKLYSPYKNVTKRDGVQQLHHQLLRSLLDYQRDQGQPVCTQQWRQLHQQHQYPDR